MSETLRPKPSLHLRDVATRKSTLCVLALFVGAAIVYPIFPVLLWVLGFWVICGVIDVYRNVGCNGALLAQYFTGNGVLTWLLSPINLALDLLARKSPHVLRLEDYPESHRAELKSVLAVFETHKDEIAQKLRQASEQNQRTMCFYRWYGEHSDPTFAEFHRPFAHIETIGVSVFKGKSATSWHFGPLRANLRVLYNFYPGTERNAYISAQGQTHYWSDGAFYSFDDTLLHISVNDSDHSRYCAFIDIHRPAHAPFILRGVNRFVRWLFRSSKGVFYRNWKLIH